MVCLSNIQGPNDFWCILVILPLYMRIFTVWELLKKNVDVIVCNIPKNDGNTHWTLLDNMIYFSLFIQIYKMYVKHTCKSWILQMAVLQPVPFNKKTNGGKCPLMFELYLAMLWICTQATNSGGKKWSQDTRTKICSFSNGPLRWAKASQSR